MAPGKDQLVDKATVAISNANKGTELLQRVIDTLEGERELDLESESEQAVAFLQKSLDQASELLEELEDEP